MPGAILNELPPINTLLQVDVEGVGWSLFLVYCTTECTIYLIKYDEVDFFEKIDITHHQAGRPLSLPSDFRMLPNESPAPAVNDCVVWGWCFDHLRSPERLGVAEVLLPGRGGNYRVTEKKLESVDRFSWVKRIYSPGGREFRTLEKLAHFLFADQPEQKALALKALANEKAAADSSASVLLPAVGDIPPPALPDVAAGELPDVAARDAALMAIERGVELWRARTMAKVFATNLERLDEHVVQLAREDGHQLGVLVSGTAAKVKLERVLIDCDVAVRAERAFNEAMAAVEHLEREVTAKQEEMLVVATNTLSEIEQTELKIEQAERKIEATKRVLAEVMATLPPDSALAARPAEAIGELLVSIDQMDQAPILSKKRHLHRVKRVMKPLVGFAPARLIAKKRAVREAKKVREVQLKRAALDVAEQLPASISQYISSSAGMHAAAAAGLAEEERRLECVQAKFAGLDRSELAKEHIEEAGRQVANHRSHVAVLNEADREVCDKLEAMVPSLQSVIEMLTPGAKRSFGDKLLSDTSPTAAAPSIASIIGAVHTLAKLVPPPPLTESKKRKRSLLHRLIQWGSAHLGEVGAPTAAD